MRILLLSFTYRGECLSEKIIEKMSNHELYGERLYLESSSNNMLSLDDFIGFDGLIFIGAVGIAVRQIAPFVKDKLSDPAVIVIDEMGRNVIPLLSGHFGGANELATALADAIKAYPVITTASDLSEVMAFDEFAKANGLKIIQRDNIKKVTKGLMEGVAKNLCISDDVVITSDENDIDSKVLGLMIKPIIVGIGCKKDIEFDELESFFLDRLSYFNIDINNIYGLATIDIKKDEKAIKLLSDKYDIPLYLYSAKELEAVEGVFEESDFVRKVTGVGAVSARAAKALGKRGKFICQKEIREGMTLSFFEKLRRVTFKY